MKTVLIIDDNEMFRFVLAQWLEVEGFYPVTAEDGLEGIRLAQSRCPDLIFCDVNMPALDGIEVLKQIRNDVNTAHIPFFFLTSEAGLSLSLMEKLGASGFISKGAEIQGIQQALTLIKG